MDDQEVDELEEAESIDEAIEQITKIMATNAENVNKVAENLVTLSKTVTNIMSSVATIVQEQKRQLLTIKLALGERNFKIYYGTASYVTAVFFYMEELEKVKKTGDEIREVDIRKALTDLSKQNPEMFNEACDNFWNYYQKIQEKKDGDDNADQHGM